MYAFDVKLKVSWIKRFQFQVAVDISEQNFL